YTFKHALTHEVVYASLLQARRCELHIRIVEVIEELYLDRAAEHVERLAHHSIRGESWEKAVSYSRQAGAKAGERSVCREALAYLEQALGALDHLTKSRQTHELAIDIRFDLRTPLMALGKLERRSALLRDAETLAEAVGDVRRLVQALIFTTNHLLTVG